MSWFETAIDVDAKAAAAIYQGMHDVALADGHVHERELEMIEAFRSDIPQDAFPAKSDAINTPELARLYVRSLIMVALADGVISDAEADVINARATDVGLGDDDILARTRDVKTLFIEQFKDVIHFRESVETVARGLGFKDADIKSLFG